MKIDPLKSQLIEELGVYFENNKILAPLAARIFSMLILSDREGICFDEFVEGLDASKSSISTNLQLLQVSGRIVYFTKPGDRKRYFKISPNDIFEQLEKKVEQWETEKKLHLKIYEFKKNICLKNNTYDENMPGFRYIKNYTSLIDNMVQNLRKLQENLKNPNDDNSL